MDKNTKINLVLLLLITALSIAAVYSSFTATHITGPTALAEDNYGSVYVALPEKIVSFNSFGSIQKEIYLDDIGLEGPVEELQVLSDGRVFVGDGGQRRVVSCQRDFTACDSPVASSYDAGRFHKFYVDETQQRILLVNTDRHTLVELDMGGELRRTIIGKNDKLKFPVGLFYLGNDTLLLTSSLNHRIYQYDISGNKAIRQKTVNIDSGMIVNNQRLPINLTRTDNGHWWVIAQGKKLVGSSLLEFDENWQLVAVTGTNQVLHPVDVLSLGNWMLVADWHGVALDAFNQRGELLEKFGESAFQKELDRNRALKSFLETGKYVAIAVVIVLLVVALLIEQKRKKAERRLAKETEQRVRSSGLDEAYMEIHAKTTILRMMSLLPVLFLLTFIIPGIFLRDSSPELLKTLLFGLVPVVFIFIAVIVMTMRHIPKKFWSKMAI